MSKIRGLEEIDPTIDDFSYLLSLVIKTVHPGINQAAAAELIVDFIETELTEARAVEIGVLIRSTAASSGGNPESLH